MHTVRGDGIAGIRRCCRDLSGDGVRNLATSSGRGRLKEDLESSTWRRYNDLDDGEVLNELIEYENVGMLRREREINSFDEDDLLFQCMIGFRKFVAYFDPFLPMNIITRNFTYITDFMVLEDIREFIMSDMAEVLMGKPFRKITKLKYDVAKGLFSFTKIFDTYIFRMHRTIPRLKNFNWNKVPPLLELTQHDLMSRL
ncbi:hypothetical protein Tco_1299403, partial [Tanacetum coccineum]